MILSGGIATGIVFGSIALIIILIIILVKIDKAKTDRVRKTSPYFRKILELNNKTSFKTISGSFTRVSNTLSTKRQFDNFNYIKKCDEYIADYLEQFIYIVDGIEYNKKAYKEYSEAFRALKHTDSVELAKQNKMSLASFVKRETKLATAAYIKPVMDYTVNGISCISVNGLSFKHFIAIAASMNKSVAVITDNDGNIDAVNNLKNEYFETYNDKNRLAIFSDPDVNNRTFEICLYNSNKVYLENIIPLNSTSVYSHKYSNGNRYLGKMLNQKTDTALLIRNDENFNEKIEVPNYINEALKFIKNAE